MKRVGYIINKDGRRITLLEAMGDYGNVQKAYNKARKCKRHRKDVLIFTKDKEENLDKVREVLWSSFFVTLVAKKIVLINLCCRPCFIWGSITIITVWTNMIIINVCKFFYLLIECFLCCKLIQICAFFKVLK